VDSLLTQQKERNMKDATSVSVMLGDKKLTLEAGVLAQQAAGSCTVTLGDTVLFSAVTCTSQPREGIDYFPLQVEYREKFYAAGRFPGGFFKREARPSENEILTSRFTDRPIRPLFPEGYFNDVQINNMLLSADGVNDSDILSIVASSASLVLSEIPFLGPIAGVRVARVNGEFVVNPTHEERAASDLDLIYASNRDLPLMIEGGGKEIAEADLVAAMKFAHDFCVKICDAQLELRAKLGLPEKVINLPEQDTTLLDTAKELAEEQFLQLLTIPGKLERQEKVNTAKEELKAKLAEKFEDMTDEQFRDMFDKFEIGVVRKNALEFDKRIDGRGFDELRELKAQLGFLPRTHGSALFNRGETQALGTVTLGTKSDKQSVDAITGGKNDKQFMLHYNFPPYSVGECGRLGFTGRREIGHGALAERSLREVVPEDYPYTIRLVSDIMGSNGSSSMASICVGSLAMMDAGVRINAPVAGISIGLYSDETKAKLVTDIIGAEDHCGDMDFKVAGTRNGITGFQVDLKIPGLKWDLVEGAFAQAKDARCKILDFMESVIPAPREELSQHAPRIEQIQIDPDKIGELIGPGGKNIRRITEVSGAQIDIDEDGTVSIYASNGEAMELATLEIKKISMEAEVGELYEGRVTGIKDFGAFVEILPGKDGLVHISEMADCRINSVEDICKVGDTMWVKCIGIDDRGRIKLSRREAMHDMDEAGDE
jgi:polyribonucleotide nucleotidyltransferase